VYANRAARMTEGIQETVLFDITIPAIAEFAACSQFYMRLGRRLCELASREAPLIFNLFHSHRSMFDGAGDDDSEVFYSCVPYAGDPVPYAEDIRLAKQAVGKVYSSAFETGVEDVLNHAEDVRRWSDQAYIELLEAMKPEIGQVKQFFERQGIPCPCQAFYEELENVGIMD
jgi:hypothetical protein